MYEFTLVVGWRLFLEPGADPSSMASSGGEEPPPTLPLLLLYTLTTGAWIGSAFGLPLPLTA